MTQVGSLELVLLPAEEFSLGVHTQTLLEVSLDTTQLKRRGAL